MRLLDLFCGAGGAAVGYYHAGFTDIVGVDIEPQPRYPFDFIEMDALEHMKEFGHHFDVIHASPPCQRFSVETPQEYKHHHPDLIAPTRKALQALDKPYIIENVTGARYELVDPLMLCGSMFGLPIWRHRWFEIMPSTLMLTPPCNHSFIPVLITGTPRRIGYPRKDPSADVRRKAMQTPWMVTIDMDQAIPPAYTEWIGKQLLKVLELNNANLSHRSATI